MTTRSFRKSRTSSRQAGQAMLVFLLALGIFLVGAIGFAVDMSHLWLHRQTAQTVADSACTAGVMDMLGTANGATLSPGFTAGTAFQCSGSTTAAPCKYAAMNSGYDAAALSSSVPGYDVNFSFPSSVPGIPACSGTPPAAVCITPSAVSSHPYLQVNVTDRVQTFFAGLIRGSTTMDVGAQATCGLVLSNSPIPILVLNPSISGSLSGNGNIDIHIVGGPQRSIQVNSSSASAVSVAGASGSINLTQGGPNNPPTGSDFGVTGSQAQVGIFSTGSNGHWVDPTGAISDPFAQVPAPIQPAAAPSPVYSVKGAAAAAFGCPDTAGGCDHYSPGYYAGGITVKKNQPAAASGYAVFDPGVYYLGGNFAANAQSCLRPSTAIGDGSGGTMFYFSGTATLNIGANAGTLTNCQSTKVPLTQVQCITSGAGATVLPANVISAGGLTGNVLLGACRAPTSGGTNYGDPLGTNDPLGEQRGMLFFQDRSASAVNPSWGGSGSFGLAGIMYFHYCNSADGTGKGTNCSSSAYTDNFSLQGGSASTTFVVGDIVVDELSLGGNPSITMDLNPNALYYVLKATLLQ
jgi:hypothetical protein